MNIEVCAVFSPRPDHPQWRDDYYDILDAQRESAIRVGHTHRVVTDKALRGHDIIMTDLGDELMRATILGVIRRLEAPINSHIVFVDVDCLVGRGIGPVFRKRQFDLGLTIRANEVAPVNNGVMYVNQEGVANALMFFRDALERCGTHWGADQEAISQAAAPVPAEQSYGKRNGAEIAFLSCKHYAPVPKAPGVKHLGAPVVHFKGATKDWMLDYARQFCGYGG